MIAYVGGVGGRAQERMPDVRGVAPRGMMTYAADKLAKVKGKVTGAFKGGCAPIPPPGKIDYMMFGFVDEAVPKDADFIHTLEWHLANSYYWSGSFLRDYLFFCANWHPLLGIILCHPNHPWSKTERLFMMLVSLSLVMVPSAYIGKTYKPDDPERMAYIVCLVSIPDIVIGVILYQVSIGETRCPMCSWCFKQLSRAMICAALCVGALSSGISFLMLSQSGEPIDWVKLFEPLLRGLCTGWLTWFPIWLLLPCQLGFLSLWCAERKQAESGLEAMIPEDAETSHEDVSGSDSDARGC